MDPEFLRRMLGAPRDLHTLLSLERERISQQRIQHDERWEALEVIERRCAEDPELKKAIEVMVE